MTLAASGAVGSGSHSAQPAPTLPPATSVSDTQLYAKLSRIVTRTLGPGPGQTRTRLLSIQVETPVSDFIPPESPHRLSQYRSVTITFRLNDHPLGPLWRMKAARADIFGVMKALYTSQLPIYDVQMNGVFPVRKSNKIRTQTVVVAYLDHYTASQIPWKRWGREAEGRLWAMLTDHYVDPAFA